MKCPTGPNQLDHAEPNQDLHNRGVDRRKTVHDVAFLGLIMSVETHFLSLKITGYVEKRSTDATCIFSRNGQSYEHNLNRRSAVLRKQIISLQQESSKL
jgi:hypothetical protein